MSRFVKKFKENPIVSISATVSLIIAFVGALWSIELHFVNQTELDQILMVQFNDKIIELEMSLDPDLSEDAIKSITKFRIKQLKNIVKQMEHH